MKERPILFSAPMVRATLEVRKTLRKTQTRRTVKGVPEWCDSAGYTCFTPKCPYGQVGDQLWVRETWAYSPDGYGTKHHSQCLYAATDEISGIKKIPSIYMPRWASRIKLEITGIRVERLNDISNEDAIAEGVGSHWICSDSMPHNPHLNHNQLSRFIDLWKSINGHDSWNQNPWVWVIEFKRIK